MIYYDGLLEEKALSTNLSILEKDYEDAILNKVELDERVFLDEDDSLLGSSSLSGGAISISGTKVYISYTTWPFDNFNCLILYYSFS